MPSAVVGFSVRDLSDDEGYLQLPSFSDELDEIPAALALTLMLPLDSPWMAFEWVALPALSAVTVAEPKPNEVDEKVTFAPGETFAT